MANISVLGAGGWGIALACSLADRHNVVIWSPFEEETSLLNAKRENQRLLPGVTIPDSIEITSDINRIEKSDITVIATPSFAVRETAKMLKEQQTLKTIWNTQQHMLKI